MCGRFTLTATPETLSQALALSDVPSVLQPRYNIAPSQPVAVVTSADERRVELYRWGLIPSWAKEASIGNSLINARVETVAEKPAFRAAFARRRCLVLADGFYEWQRADKRKGTPSQPYYFRLASGEPFAFAGLWEVWKDPQGELLHTCTLITGPANERVAPVHDRSPVILQGEPLWHWLEPDATREELRSLLQPTPAERMASYPVSSLVNSPGNDLAACIVPLEPTEAENSA